MRDGTPLYTALKNEADKQTVRMHMPGHKGKRTTGFDSADLFEIDFTELAATGNLYEGIPPISDAEELMATVAGAKECYFLTGGSTQGIMTAMATACPPGSKVIVDRGSHKAIWSAMVHLDLYPVYVYADHILPWRISAPIKAIEIERALTENPEAAAVILTSPSYYGVLTDIAEIAAVTERWKIPLIIDEAHGAHLPFISGGKGAVSQGASLSTASAHKTMPALTPGAFLFSSGGYDPREIRRKAALFGTSSPSYAVMVSMDLARAYMEDEGGAQYDHVAEVIKQIREKINAAGRFHALTESSSIRLDPTRLTVNTDVGGVSGYEAARILEAEYNIVCEMADRRNVVMIATCADSDSDLDRVYLALTDIAIKYGSVYKAPECYMNMNEIQGGSLRQVPVQKLSPREAAYAHRTYMKLKDAAGKTIGEHLAPYPPGIPVIAAGEELRPEHLDYLRDMGFDMEKEIAVII